MGTFRHVKISMWQDPFFFNLCTHDKLFHNYLITNGKSTQCGIFEQSTKLMALELGYDESLVLEQIKNFVQWGKLYFDPLTNEFFLASWLTHNFSSSPSVIACIENELKSVKSKILKEFWTQCVQSVYSVWGKEKEKEVKKENIKIKEEARASIKPTSKLSKQGEDKKDDPALGEEDLTGDKAIPPNERCTQIISYLNQKAGTHFRADNFSTADLIDQKLKKGYSLQDFYTVIDNKTKEWLKTNMAVNLRPYTLFAGHFDDYLAQLPKAGYTARDRCSIFVHDGFVKVS